MLAATNTLVYALAFTLKVYSKTGSTYKLLILTEMSRDISKTMEIKREGYTSKNIMGYLDLDKQHVGQQYLSVILIKPTGLSHIELQHRNRV